MIRPDYRQIEASVRGFGNFSVEGIDPLIVFDSSVLDVKKVSKISSRAEEKPRSTSGNW